MTNLERRARVFAACLAALAGFVDAIGFIETGGFFVSFMSGNSTRLAVGVAGPLRDALFAAGVIACFVGGVTGGSIAAARLPPRGATVVLALIAALLALAAILQGSQAPLLAIGLLAFAMGAENAVFERDGEVRVGVTYMTGSLVRVGSGIAGAILGRPGNGWANYLLLWLGFVGGAITGAITHDVAGTLSLWIASAIALLMSVAANRLFRSSRP